MADMLMSFWYSLQLDFDLVCHFLIHFELFGISQPRIVENTVIVLVIILPVDTQIG